MNLNVGKVEENFTWGEPVNSYLFLRGVYY